MSMETVTKTGKNWFLTTASGKPLPTTHQNGSPIPPAESQCPALGVPHNSPIQWAMKAGRCFA